MKRFSTIAKALVVGLTLTGTTFSAHASVRGTSIVTERITEKLSMESDNIFGPAVPGEFESLTSKAEPAQTKEPAQVAWYYYWYQYQYSPFGYHYHYRFWPY